MTKKDVPGDNASGTVVSGNAVVSGNPAGSGNAVVSGDAATSGNGMTDALARITEEDLPPAERRRAVGQLAAALRGRGFTEFLRPKAAMTWISDQVVEIAPRIPVRSLPALRGQHPGLSDHDIADRIVRQAGRASASIGAIGGGISAIEWAAPPALLTAPAVLAAETVAVVAVELKLLAELQELYGQPVPGSPTQRAVSLLTAWAGRRGVSLLVPGRGLTAVLGTAARHELRDRLIRRFGRNLTALGPLFTGAAAAAYLNRRATLRLAHEVRKDLTERAHAG